MLIFVLTFNLGLTLLNLYLIYCLRRWQRRLSRLTLQIRCFEQYCDGYLSPAPAHLSPLQNRSQSLRKLYRRLLRSGLQAQSFWWAVGIGWQVRRQKSN